MAVTDEVQPIEGIKNSRDEIRRFEPKNTLDVQECFQDFVDNCPSVLPTSRSNLSVPYPTRSVRPVSQNPTTHPERSKK